MNTERAAYCRKDAGIASYDLPKRFESFGAHKDRRRLQRRKNDIEDRIKRISQVLHDSNLF